MKKILLPLTLLLGACSNSGTTTTTTTPEPAAAETAAASSDTTAATAPAAAPDTDSSAVDAASGATSVPNETLFNGILVLPPQNRATVTLTMGGSVRSTTLLPGAYVKQGDVLATLENPEFITLQQTYLDSRSTNTCVRSICVSRRFRARRPLRRNATSRAVPSISRCAAAWRLPPLSWPCWVWIRPVC